ncbi:MAG: T9SS type A sorting domain-containing protein, partial [Bacteroidota bacterium]
PNLQFNMSVIGKIQISPGVFSVNENDILGAFVGAECRGVANPFSSLGGILFMTIGSNIQLGETVTFKIYLASTNQIVDAIETIPFQNAGEVGTMANPFIFTYSAPCSLTVTPSNQNVAYNPSTATSFAVITTCIWSAVSDQIWCAVTSSGSGNGTVTASCGQNTSINQRIANITVTVPGQTPVVVTVIQAGAPGPPTWTPVPNLQFNMNVIGKIQLSPGVFSLNQNDKIGAFVGAECRGVANPFASLGGALFLTIGSNVLSGETATFKIFLASTNEIVNVNETMPFQNAAEIGTMANPYIFTFPMQNNVIVQGLTINSGQTVCLNALQTITVAGAGTNFLLKNGGSATMIAGQKISILAGATVQSGGYLHAYITTTNSYCSSIPPSVANLLGEEEMKFPGTQKSSLFIVYPNPTAGKFILELSGKKSPSSALVRIYNMKGLEVLTKQLPSSEKSEFSLENQAPGIYLISLIYDGKTETARIMKQ